MGSMGGVMYAAISDTLQVLRRRSKHWQPRISRLLFTATGTVGACLMVGGTSEAQPAPAPPPPWPSTPTPQPL